MSHKQQSYFDGLTADDATDMACAYLRYEVEWLCQSPNGMLAAEAELERLLEDVRQRIMRYAQKGTVK